MANVLNGIFGGKSAETPLANPDSDFADFAGAPDPVPADAPVRGTANFAGPAEPSPGVPWTKWWAIHERHSLSEFKLEGIIICIGIAVLIVHLIGSRMNRNKAKAWAKAHGPALKNEFASVGFEGKSTVDTDPSDTTGVLKEKSLFEFSSYATGRQNAAFVDVDLKLVRRFNPMTSIAETVLSFFTDFVPAPQDSMDATLYPFDGKESVTVPSVPGTHELRSKEGKSTFDGFVWAIVAKEHMKKLREERYDVSLTFTKDHPKLPNWLSVMSENAEITNTLLTPELIEAVKDAGDNFEYLIVSDQPMEKPKTLEEASNPRKRIFLRYTLPGNNDYSTLTPLFEQYLRLPDYLVANAHFRGEVMRKVNRLRDDQINSLKKEVEAKDAEERTAERERQKKAKRDQELAGMDAKQQKKYLEKERDKEQRKAAKKQTMRG